MYGTDFYVTKKFHNTKKWNDFVRYKLRWKLRLATAEKLKIRKDKENKDKQELELLQMAYERAKSNKKRVSNIRRNEVSRKYANSISENKMDQNNNKQDQNNNKIEEKKKKKK